MTSVKKIYKLCLLLSVIYILNLQSCRPISVYSESAYTQAVRLKVETLRLMDEGSESYSKHVGEIDSLKNELNFAYEYAKGRPNNEITVKQWEIMINPDRNLIGGFLRIWEEDLILSPVFVSEAQSVIGDAFDTIIGLESGKIKPSDIVE
jgi:hypothetical protein